MNSVELIKELCNAFGPSGFEDDVLEIAKKHVPGGFSTSRDSMLNLYIDRPRSEERPLIAFDAHSDEVGLIVQAVRDDGCIVFTTLGGWVPAALYAQRMVIKNRQGRLVTGVIAAASPHQGGEDSPSIEKMLLDIGARSKAEVEDEYKIGTGCAVAPVPHFELQGDTMISKAFDCRIGCAGVLHTLAALKDQPLAVDVCGLLSSQEEVGLRGARLAAARAVPDLVICFEGAPADDTLAAPFMVQTAMGRGPMIRHYDSAMIANPRLVRLALDIAEKHAIPVQQAVRTRGGTNGGAYQLTAPGIPALVISLPVRYIHSHNCMASLSDYENAVKLAAAIAKDLTPEAIAGL
jgi:putative aminopeptidase FrvX